MRPVEPLLSGRLESQGYQIGYETFGDPKGRPFLLLPTWQIGHSRFWKMQIPFLARYGYVITYDAAGCGRSERTEDPAAFEYDRIVDQGIDLLDHLSIEKADVISLSRGTWYAMLMAACYPKRVSSLVLIGNVFDPDQEPVLNQKELFWQKQEKYVGWGKWNAHYWLDNYKQWLEFFFENVFSEPHSTKPIDDAISWGLETTPEILVRTAADSDLKPKTPLANIVKQVACPVLLIHGGEDRIVEVERSQKLAETRPDFQLAILEGCGHAPLVRDPVRVNGLIEDFLNLRKPERRRWRRAMTRHTPRALFISSPIGLGHVHRDLEIARQLRQRVPELEIEWLAQHPVTRVLKEAGETIHPMSALLASESAHWERSSNGHGLHCFYAWRDMDEILLANFMVFLDVVRDTHYDLWIGDESWEVDYYLHENPELKTAPYVFMTDFLGWVPIDRSPGSREAFLTADYNAEMIEQVERFKHIRDRAIYIGKYEDLLPERFGPGLPLIPEWTGEHFIAVGDYIVAFNPADYADTRAVRERLGYRAEQPLLIVTVGGTAVGQSLLQKACAAWPLIHREQPDARCVIVAGPRIDPANLPKHEAMEVRPYVHNLYEHLAVADLAIVQGGLSTTMELAAMKRPFLYFPIVNHCEQQYHVTHRLGRYKAGKRLDYAETSSQTLAEIALGNLGSDTNGTCSLEPGSASRAAEIIAELL